MGLIAAGVMAAGVGLSAYSQSQAARSANNAVNSRLAANKADTLYQRDQFGSAVFGRNWLDTVDNNKENPYWNKSQRDAWGNFSDSLGGPIYDQVKGLSSEAANQAGNIPASYLADTQALKAQGEANVKDITGYYNQGTGKVLGDFDRGAAGINATADQYGRGRAAVINQDAGIALKAANQASSARLRASGLGGTLGATAAAGNTVANEQAKQRSLQDLADQQARLKTSVGSNLLGQRTNTAAGLMQAGAGARERGLATNLQLGADRSNAQSNLNNQAFDRYWNYKYQPTQFAMNALQGSQLSPYADYSGSIPLASASPSAAAAGTLGSAVTGIGSAYGTYALLQAQQRQGGFNGYGGQMDQMYASNR